MPHALLIRTKLSPPNSNRRMVERKRLRLRHDGLLKKKLTLIAAPAGYGKTTLLFDLFKAVSEKEQHCGWVSLDRDDNDLAQFLAYFVAALNAKGSTSCLATQGLLSSGISFPQDVLRNTFLNDLASIATPTYIFLDDFHVILDPGVLGIVDAMLRAPIDSLHLLVSSRHLQNLPLSRLNVQGQLGTIDAAELGFSRDETREFLENESITNLSSDDLDLLQRKTEGWAAGLQLATIAMADKAQRATFLKTFCGETHSVSDFLAEEVFRKQPPHVQEFLLVTSVLGRFNASLCNALVGIDNAKELIEELAERNLFLFNLDDEWKWFRYHHLFAELLYRKLCDERPNQFETYHLNASRWFEQNRYPVEAIEHAFAANAYDVAARILEESSNRLFSEGKTATLTSFASRLPPDYLDRLPLLLLDCAWYKELCWRFKDARTILTRVRKELTRLQAEPTSQCEPKIVLIAATLSHREMMLDLLSDDPLSAKEKAQRWLEDETTRDPFMCASAGTAVMHGNREQYLCRDTAATAKILSDLFIEGGARYGIPFHESVVGITHFMVGDLQRAEASYIRGLSTAEDLHGRLSPLYAMPAVLLAELWYEQNRLAEAASIISEIEVGADLGFVDKLIAGYITRAKLAAREGDFSVAAEVLAEGDEVADRFGFTRLHANILNERVRQFIHLGRVAEAQASIGESRYASDLSIRLTPRDGLTTKHEFLALACSRTWLAVGDVANATAILRQWYTFAEARGCRRSAIRCGALLVRAFLQMGDLKRARRLLQSLLQSGQRARFVSTFIDEGSIVVDQIRELSRSNAEIPMLDVDYLNGFVQPQSERRTELREAPAPLAPSRTGDVSSREMQIISLGARGLPNNDIAKTLCLAESTVKWYWQRVFEKLDVRRRSEAIKKARSLQWID